MVATARSSAAVGVFDSGLGGLSVVRALRDGLPNESILYVADSVHCPYGARPVDEIRALSRGITQLLLDRGCKLIVVACNTASAAALSYLRKMFPQVSFVGMVPAVKVATGLTKSGVVGVLATPGTLAGALYEDVVEHHASGVRVIAHASPELVDLVEAGELQGARTRQALSDAAQGMLAAGADVIVLGCTHYPFLMPALAEVAGSSVRLIEPSEAIARRAAFLLDRDGLAADDLPGEPLRCAVTGDRARFGRMLGLLLGDAAPVEALEWCGEQLVSVERSE